MEVVLSGLLLGTLVGKITNIALVALGLGLVIFFHELGHFAVAKWCDVKVERFSIGFGPIIYSFKYRETEYALSIIPFGGYVKMLGQDDVDPSQLTSEEIALDPRSYSA
ncbi:MAG: site-2 protease family protein, partial [Planctomycetaceae bacterium]|nr:site-2 protease family protein [Planctomycetaceae bacterium]